MGRRVSVALCTFNGARYIRAQVASVLAQTRAPDELVVSDDGSADDTVALVEAELRRHERETGTAPELVVLRNEQPLGVTANFEQALRACTGELIALCDQDDEWEPTKLAKLVAMFDARPGLQFLHTDARLIDDDGKPIGGTLFGALEVTAEDRAAIHSGAPFRVFIRRNLATGATAMIDRSLLDVSVPFPAAWVHDEWLAVQAAARRRLDLTDEPLTRYRRHAANQIGAGDPTLGHKVRRVLGRRGERNWMLAERSRILAQSLKSAGDVDGSTIRLAEEKAEFEAVRAALPRNRIRRVAPVLRLAAGDAYERLASRGRMDIIRDLFQPA